MGGCRHLIRFGTQRLCNCPCLECFCPECLSVDQGTLHSFLGHLVGVDRRQRCLQEWVPAVLLTFFPERCRRGRVVRRGRVIVFVAIDLNVPLEKVASASKVVKVVVVADGDPRIPLRRRQPARRDQPGACQFR